VIALRRKLGTLAAEALENMDFSSPAPSEKSSPAEIVHIK
jgi:hypothetical protein